MTRLNVVRWHLKVIFLSVSIERSIIFLKERSQIISVHSAANYLTITITKKISAPCHSGTYRDSSMLECRKCPANTYSTEGAGLCIACPQGSVASEDRTICGKAKGLASSRLLTVQSFSISKCYCLLQFFPSLLF